ncbi:anthocyanidin 5,3-O-glucosyltransferase-like [Iris pallida]|uniref:Glycosyltransferase n=1 Tax=Iris pallida TaxID=29817 RepID=A0AAX6FQ36_IRIPA|nr:anthocyanidin 5,3-O-glucosyltransferase-like [Iris pallida]
MELTQSVILYPSLGMGHLIPMLELAKLFIDHGFSVTIVVIDSPQSDTSSAVDSFISRASSSYPSLSFHRLPKVAPPASKHPMIFLSETVRLANDNLLDFLSSKKSTSDIRAVVLDMFCSVSLDVVEELHLPSYFFFSSSASILAACLFFPTLQSQLAGSLRDLGSSPLHFPGLPPIPASDLPAHMQVPGESYDAALAHFVRMPRADGIMINTFESLEKRAVRALVDGACVPGRAMPPVYCIGPLIADGSDAEECGERHECLAWLDAQPERSVVFLCFGSMGSFPTEQLKETANGLERSGQRFLWVVRSPPSDPAKPFDQPMPEAELEDLLPEGFLERTREQGMVVESWAPQAAVLAHRSVGGFVSHCGWNSTLEAVCSGVPMLGWPLYAEQRMNCVFLVEEAKVAVAMEGLHKGLVTADEVETKIRRLMESDEGRALGERMAATKERAVAARMEGGESTLALLELVTALRKATPATGGA